MTVKELLATTKQIQTKWTTNVVNARSTEQNQLQSHLGATVTYTDITNEFNRWVSALSLLADKPRVSQAISKNLLIAVSTSLRGLNTALDTATNSVEWMCTNRNFGTWYALSISLIRELSLDSAREAAKKFGYSFLSPFASFAQPSRPLRSGSPRSPSNAPFTTEKVILLCYKLMSCLR